MDYVTEYDDRQVFLHVRPYNETPGGNWFGIEFEMRLDRKSNVGEFARSVRWRQSFEEFNEIVKDAAVLQISVRFIVDILEREFRERVLIS